MVWSKSPLCACKTQKTRFSFLGMKFMAASMLKEAREGHMRSVDMKASLRKIELALSEIRFDHKKKLFSPFSNSLVKVRTLTR